MTTMPKLPEPRARKHRIHCAMYDPTPGPCDCGSRPKVYDTDDMRARDAEVWRCAMEAAALVALAEKVDAAATGDATDASYNIACEQIAAALRALPVPQQETPE